MEAALKLSRKYACTQKGAERFQIISMKQSFHGRTFGSISATGQEKYHKGFAPLLPGIIYCEFNDFSQLESLASEQTCAYYH
ncbi:MAG: aminotransferase class III-fold pyridoxal phosphate-dependent enzyme [Bacillus subtilis]|nr:aminotransferase class III-fold pyridoxal phosphate-dependent enzyme [Bacillus subtilis]